MMRIEGLIIFASTILLSTISIIAEQMQTLALPNDHESSSLVIENHICRIPTDWHGDWYQYNEHTGGTSSITINETHVSTNGRCGRLSTADSAGAYKTDKEFEMLLISKDRTGSSCWLCMLIFERHHNILQYRISRKCVSNQDEACHMVDINSPMRIMFRADAMTEPCPVSGPANFSYSTVTDERCDTHKSTIAGCVDESRLRLSYVACPGMRMESRMDDLLCIGRFEAYNRKYFVARIINKAFAGSEGDLFRCFMYETTPSGGTLMISGDASCQSLDMDQASVKIRYTSVDPTPKADCVFRPWMRHRSHNKDAGITWESLSSINGDRHVFDRHKWSVQRNVGGSRKDKSGTTNIQAINLCVHYDADHKEEKLSSDGARVDRIVVYSVEECIRGYRCVEFYHHPKRSRNQVMDILIGNFAPTSFEACKSDYFDKENLHYETLLDATSRELECPNENRGQYRIRGCDENDAALYFGCGEKNALIFYEDCNQNKPNLYYCYGNWIDPVNPNVNYLAVKDAASGRKTCFAYTKSRDDDELALSTFHQHSCRRGIFPGISASGHRTYNLTKAGLCDPIPLHIANLTQTDAAARYDESSLFARSINGRTNAAVSSRYWTTGFMVTIFVIVLG